MIKNKSDRQCFWRRADKFYWDDKNKVLLHRVLIKNIGKFMYNTIIFNIHAIFQEYSQTILLLNCTTVCLENIGSVNCTALDFYVVCPLNSTHLFIICFFFYVLLEHYIRIETNKREMWRAVRDDHGTGHLGCDKTIDSIQMWLYFTGLKDKVSAYVTSCEYCQRVKSGLKFGKGCKSLTPMDILNRVWHKMDIDLITNLQKCPRVTT